MRKLTLPEGMGDQNPKLRTKSGSSVKHNPNYPNRTRAIGKESKIKGNKKKEQMEGRKASATKRYF